MLNNKKELQENLQNYIKEINTIKEKVLKSYENILNGTTYNLFQDHIINYINKRYY